MPFEGFPDSSVGKESTCNAGDPGSIPGSGRSAGEGIGYPLQVFLGFPCGSAGIESSYNAEDMASIPRLGRSPGEGKGYPLQYSGLENYMDSIVHGIVQARILDWGAFTSPGDLPDPGIEPGSPALQVDSLPTELSGKPNT